MADRRNEPLIYGDGEMTLARLDWILSKAQDIVLSAWEERFIDGFIERREKFKEHVSVTEKQAEVLERIAQRCE